MVSNSSAVVGGRTKARRWLKLRRHGPMYEWSSGHKFYVQVNVRGAEVYVW